MTTMNVCHVDHKTRKMSNPLITHAYDSSHMQINKQNKGVKTAEVKKQVKKLGVIKPHKGHTTYLHIPKYKHRKFAKSTQRRRNLLA